MLNTYYKKTPGPAALITYSCDRTEFRRKVAVNGKAVALWADVFFLTKFNL